MAEIFIPFNPQMVDAIDAGNKSCTSRYSVYGQVGDIFRLRGRVYKIVAVKTPVLKFVKDNLWQQEGFASALDFENFWVKLHPKRGFRPNDRVYTHFFEEVR